MAGVSFKIYGPVSLLPEVKGILEDKKFVIKEPACEYHIYHATHFSKAMVDCFVNRDQSQLSIILHNAAEVLVKDAIMALEEGLVGEPAKEALQTP